MCHMEQNGDRAHGDTKVLIIADGNQTSNVGRESRLEFQFMVHYP